MDPTTQGEDCGMGETAVGIWGKNDLPQGGKEGGTKKTLKEILLCIRFSVPRATDRTRWGPCSDSADKKAETQIGSGTYPRPHRK